MKIATIGDIHQEGIKLITMVVKLEKMKPMPVLEEVVVVFLLVMTVYL